ncbi:MAG: protein translocase subunit SecD [Actinomycetota bacterium]
MRGVRGYVWSVALVALVVAGILGATLATGLRPRLGLDLRGGLRVILTAPEGTRSDVLDKTVEVLRNRVDKAGVAEPEISREGSTNILIQLPGTKDPERLLGLVGRTAQLQFRQVLEEIFEGDPRYESIQVSASDDPNAEMVLLGEEKTKLRLSPMELSGSAIRDARASLDPGETFWSVNLRFDREGAKRWEAFTGRLACLQGPTRQIGIVLDAVVESHVPPAEDVQCNVGITGGDTRITGSFTQEEARNLALVLTTGALPVTLQQSEVTTVSATLGRESLRAGLIAGFLGLALVMLYVLIYYRALGLQTWVGLMVFASVIYGLVVLLGAAIGFSLTLAGIAGLIVSIGIATDSYIVFFERVKEEVHQGRTLRSSMDRGFTHAWRTLRTANFVTILAAIVLYILAVGPVRGFALTLGMATTLDLALFALLTWPLAALLARNRLFSEGRFIGMRKALEGGREAGWTRKILRSEFNIDFMGRRKLWLAVSGLLVGFSLLALVPGIRGLQFGIDFRGGTLFRAPLEREVDVAEVRAAFAAAGESGAVVQIVTDRTSDRRQIQVQTEEIESEERRGALVGILAKVAGIERNQVGLEAVGSKWGAQISRKALRGLVVFLVLVILYMSWRLEPKMAAAGIAALLHDLAVTAGVYAAVGFEVSPATLIGLLTILGYSLYDTVVIFDKIRENAASPGYARKSFAEVVNESTNQVLMRSINTSLATLIPVGSLLFVGSFLLGADTLKDLALALFVGIAAGAYSSIFVAPPLLSLWKEREPRYAAVRARALRHGLQSAPSSGGLPPAVPVTPGARLATGPEREREEEPSGLDDGRESAASSSGPAVRVQRRKPSRAQRKKGRR